MANTYDLYLGGARTYNPDTRMFPSAPYDPLATIKAADHKTPVTYAITRVLDASPSAPVTIDGTVGDPALRNFIDFQSYGLNTPIAQGDILRVVALPNGCVFDGFFWEIEVPLAGFTFSVGYSRIGNAGYVAGSHTVPNGTIGTILLNAHSGSAVASGFVDSSGTAMGADTAVGLKSTLIGGSVTAATPPALGVVSPPGDALCIRLDALATIGTGAQNFGDLRMKISPVLRELVRGQW